MSFASSFCGFLKQRISFSFALLITQSSFVHAKLFYSRKALFDIEWSLCYIYISDGALDLQSAVLVEVNYYEEAVDRAGPALGRKQGQLLDAARVHGRSEQGGGPSDYPALDWGSC